MSDPTTSALTWSKRLRADMPLLDFAVTRLKHRRPLEGRVLLLCQHQMQDELAQLDAFVELGADPHAIHWIDIPYTSHASVRAAAAADIGIPTENFSVHTFEPLGQYESYQIPRLKSWINDRWAEICAGRPLVVLDDGCYFLRALGSRPPPGPVALVEQTQRGIELTRKNADARVAARSVPVVNVAESRPKKILESPAIAAAVLTSLESDLSEIYGTARPVEDWLVLGWGSLGRAVSDLMDESRDRRSIWVAEVDPSRRSEARALGHPLWSGEDNRRFGAIIGATGTDVFAASPTFPLIDGGVLLSASSASVEFGRDRLLRRASAGLLRGPERAKSLHDHLRFEVDGREFVLANGGFPVNFDEGVVDRIPASEIQVTAACMVFGAAQAASAREPGVIDLDLEFTDSLLRAAGGLQGKSR